MKTIIAGTDFTPSSRNACRYAAFLATKLNCKLMVFNLFQAPVLHSNSGLYGVSYMSVKKTSEKRMEEFTSSLSEEFPKLKIAVVTTSGAFEEELEILINRHRIEVIVMGLQTKDRISRFIYGSHGVKIAGKIDAPVIIVPESYKDHRIESAVLAVDNVTKLSDPALKSLEALAKGLRARIKLLHVHTPDEIISSNVISAVKLGKNHVPVDVIRSKAIDSGIKNFCKAHKQDLVAIISKKHSVFYNLFNESVTKRVAFSAKIPVLAFHE